MLRPCIHYGSVVPYYHTVPVAEVEISPSCGFVQLRFDLPSEVADVAEMMSSEQAPGSVAQFGPYMDRIAWALNDDDVADPIEDHDHVPADSDGAFYEVDNPLLQDALTKMWSDCHLTSNDKIGISTCKDVHPEGEGCDGMARWHLRKGENWNSNPQTIAAMEDIHKRFRFDKLEAWMCEHGTVLFERVVDGLVRDEMAAC